MKAQKLIALNMPKPEAGQIFGEEYHDWLHAQILCREAEKRLEGAPASSQKS